MVILIETAGVKSAGALRASGIFSDLEATVGNAASYTRVITTSNIRCMGTVAHDRNGVFLFNYFFADDTRQNLAVWDYTAGWFEQETHLDNSTVLLPGEAENSDYSIINHCRWDRFRDIVPALILKRSFRTYVLANFELNNVAAIPILYRLA